MISEARGLKIIEYPFSRKIRGLCVNGTILINRNIETTAERECVIAEEVGHYHLNYGDILDQRDTSKRKQELKAKRWAYSRLIPLTKLIDAYNKGVQARFELAEFLCVTEEFLAEALEYFRIKYGFYHDLNSYTIYFDPLYVARRIN